jgi:cytochrome c oxidase assembly protein subunit 15
MTRFRRFASVVLAFNVAVIGWGALVRATGSGAGCGQHWPTCNGQVVPRSAAVDTAIELTHRATSGLALLLVLALFVWSRQLLPRRHAARRAAAYALGFIVVEALLGAGLVLFGWVAKDASAGRGFAMALHLANTFLLLAALTLTAASSREAPEARPGRAAGALPLLVALGLVATMLAGVSGAIAALGDTLFPATSFAAGLRQELDGGARLLLRLRVVHPLAAIVAAALAAACAHLAARAQPDAAVRRAAVALAALVAVQVFAGLANVLLLAPVWLQVAHLVLADAVWIALVLVGGWTLAPGREALPSAGAAAALRPS